MSARTLQPTFFTQAPDGTFHETRENDPAGRQGIIDDIVSAQIEVERIYRASGNAIEDVTETFVGEVFVAVLSLNEASCFVPLFLPDEHRRLIRSRWATPAQRKADRADAAADRAVETIRSRALAAR